MTATWVVCLKCGRCKAPIGRSVPMEMHGTLCEAPWKDSGCLGYYDTPCPDCRWPGEEQCGPGCTK